MIYPALAQRPSRLSPGLLTGAAALMVILLVGMLAVNLPFGSGGSESAGLQSPSETATAIPTATLMPANTTDSSVLISLGSTLRRDETGKQVFFAVDGVNPALISKLRVELRESQSQTLVYVGEVTSPPFELVAVPMDSLAAGWYRLEVTGLDAQGRAFSNTAILEFEHTPVSVAPLASVTATPIPFQPTVPPPSFEDATPAVLPFLIEGRLAADKPYRAYKFTAAESGVVRLLAISKSFQPTLEFTISGSAGQGGGGGGGGGGGSDPNAPIFMPTEQFLMVNAGMEVVVALSGGEGDFTLSATFSTIGEIRYDDPLSVQMSPDQTFAYVAFKGTAGTVLTVEVGKTEGVDLMLDLAEVVQMLPMAAQVSSPFQVSDDDGGSGVSPEIFQVTLPRTTTYVVIVKLKHPTDSADILLAVLTVRGQ